MSQAAIPLYPAIRSLYHELCDAPFPSSYRGGDAGGEDLVMLDADIAGLTQQFLASGRLTVAQTAMLGLLSRGAALAARDLTGEARTYFERHERLTVLVLDELRRALTRPGRSGPT